VQRSTSEISSEAGAETNSETGAVEEPYPPTAIAVLPFDNLSPEPDDAYFAAGIHDEVLNQLTQVNDLFVIARTSVLRYAGTGKPLSQIATELKVGTVLEGSVRYAGNRVRISTQLIDTFTGSQLWANAYEAELADVFAIQTDIATQIAEALKIELSLGVTERLAALPTQDPVAYSHYLRALSLWGSFQNFSETNAELDTALDRDPDFAAALGYKAKIQGYRASFAEFSDPFAFTQELQETLAEEAGESARKALAIDPNLAGAHLALANNYTYNLDGRSFDHYVRAYELNPNDYQILVSMGLSLLVRGVTEPGLALMRKSVELNPADAASIWWFSRWLGHIKRWDEALFNAQLVTKLLPDVAFGHANLARLAALAGKPDLAHEAAQRAEEAGLSAQDFPAVATAYSLIGQPQEARRIFDLSEARGYGLLANAEFHFLMYSAIGEEDAALDYIEQAIDSGFPRSILLQMHNSTVIETPEFARYNDHPRMQELMRKALKSMPPSRDVTWPPI
jgi:TolB-like protein